MPLAESYASLRRGRRPNSLLVEAIDRLAVRSGRALDIGAGPLNDAQFLLEAGLGVDAVDKDPHTIALASALNHPHLSIVHADIRDVPIAPSAYALVVAIHVLPFLPRPDLLAVMPSIVGGLIEGGILCGTFFGPQDSWAPHRPHMTFLSRAEIAPLVAPLRPLVFSERVYDGTNARGEPKRWHIFHCIFRKDNRRGV